MYQTLKARQIEAVLSNIPISMQPEKLESNWTTNSTNMKEQSIHINNRHGCRSGKALKTSVHQKKILTYQTQHEKGHTNIPVEGPPPPGQTRKKKASRPRWRKNYPQYPKKGNNRRIEIWKPRSDRETYHPLHIQFVDWIPRPQINHIGLAKLPVPTTAACSDWCEII